MRRSIILATALLTAVNISSAAIAPPPATAERIAYPRIIYGTYEFPVQTTATLYPNPEGEIYAGTTFELSISPNKVADYEAMGWDVSIDPITGVLTVSTQGDYKGSEYTPRDILIYVVARYPDGRGNWEPVILKAVDPRPTLADLNDFSRPDLTTSHDYPKYGVPTLSENFPEGVQFGIVKNTAWWQAWNSGWRFEDVSGRTQYGAMKVTPSRTGPASYTFTATATYPDGSIDESSWTITRVVPPKPTPTPTPPPPAARSGSSLSS